MTFTTKELVAFICWVVLAGAMVVCVVHFGEFGKTTEPEPEYLCGVVSDVRFIDGQSCDVGLTVGFVLEGFYVSLDIRVNEDEVYRGSYMDLSGTHINIDGRVYYRLKSRGGRNLGIVEVATLEEDWELAQ